ncbi:MAG: 1-deoxy-D-xylulose-5-phosphate synthase [Deltaproteobacteria bacterium]|nr:1-deoxy-D-xylulose-5-phosphate synthase [Deltaproteobacteria bacterium]
MSERLLDSIDTPEDLRKLDRSRLPQLVEELREEIINTVSKKGGHLGSSLGVVDLTIALHYKFNTPNDRIVWDVGHQAYAHKILTGRKKAFQTLRQYKGLSGFPKRSESEYDSFDTGHSSTSISASLGMVAARDIMEKDNRVIAVIGDGSMTAGLAFEGLNHAGHIDKNLIVILNDNEMSISENVGALSSYLSKMMTGVLYTRVRRETEHLFSHLPGGDSMLKFAKKLEESLKGLVVPGMLFEDLGFKYVGPIDGHNMESLFENLKNIKNVDGPILFHILTRKGKGYKPAEDNPAAFHGVGPFDIETGKVKSSGGGPPSYTNVFGDTIIRLAEKNEKVVGITAAMAAGTGMSKFAERFPNRYFDVGIAEQHAVTFAAGMATEGFVPIVAIYSTFMQRAYDQVVHDVALQKLPVVFALDRGGIVGADGPTHHGLFDYSFMRHVPNMVVMAPKDEQELRSLLKTATECGKPASVRYPRGAGYGVDISREISSIEVGKGELLREGNDLTIVAIGSTVYPAIEAAEKLEREGINAEVINARFVKPLDEDLILTSVKKTGYLITVEENALQGGFGSAVMELLEEKGMLADIKVKRLGVPDGFVEHGPQDVLRSVVGIDSEGIAKAAVQLAGKSATPGVRAKRKIA